MDFLWDLYQQGQINSNAQSASSANERAIESQQRVRFLEDAVDRLLLVNMAMWELVQSRTGLTEDDLITKVQEIDLRDGVADGKVTRTKAAECPKCGRPLSARHRKCLYCGCRDVSGGAFGGVK